MDRPSTSAVAAASVAGLANVAVVLAVAWGVERVIRSRVVGQNGGRFGVGSFE